MNALSSVRGMSVRLLDFRDFPSKLGISMALDSRAPGRFQLTSPSGPALAMADVRSVWWRRPQSFGLLTQNMSPQARQFALTETATAFQGMWQASQALWVNDVVRDAAAAHKPWQLELARQVGLTIPARLMSSDPERVRAFWSEHRGNVIYKPFLQTCHGWRETRQLEAEELPLLDSVRLAPVIFQELIPGRADLRVTVIGNELFPAALDLSKAEYLLDVRLNRQEYARLPVPVQERLLALMGRLGLEYGAIDLRLTPEGDYCSSR